jgi:hypothetical protein
MCSRLKKIIFRQMISPIGSIGLYALRVSTRRYGSLKIVLYGLMVCAWIFGTCRLSALCGSNGRCSVLCSFPHRWSSQRSESSVGIEQKLLRPGYHDSSAPGLFPLVDPADPHNHLSSYITKV